MTENPVHRNVRGVLYFGIGHRPPYVYIREKRRNYDYPDKNRVSILKIKKGR